MEGTVKKVGINCDMGEGFGRWKMVGPGNVCRRFWPSMILRIFLPRVATKSSSSH